MIPAGKKPPEDIYVMIEIPKGSRLKFEIEDGVVYLDRKLFTAMVYPYNYGVIPSTKAPDGDPLDALLIMEDPIPPGVVVRARPIGVLYMEDEKGEDEKIIAVPHEKIDPRYANIKDLNDLPEAILNEIKHFFEHYKELEPGKRTKVKGRGNKQEALEIIKKSLVQ